MPSLGLTSDSGRASGRSCPVELCVSGWLPLSAALDAAVLYIGCDPLRWALAPLPRFHLVTDVVYSVARCFPGCPPSLGLLFVVG